MKRHIAWWCWLVALVATAFPSVAQPKTDAPQSPTVAANGQLEKTLLWKITGAGIRKPSYLYGTIHVISAKDFFLTPATEKALGKTKRLVLEIDMSNQMQMGMQMLSLAPMKNGNTLKKLVSAEDYALVKNYFEKESSSPEVKMMPFSMIEAWQPMLLQSFLYNDIIAKPVMAYEMEFLRLAKERKMELGGLETIEDQINAFASIPYDKQAGMLVEMVKDMKSDSSASKKSFAEMVEMYRSQDVDKLIASTDSSFSAMGEDSENALLVQRNKNWIPLIIKLAQDKPTFFAVGAAHLGGETGVIRLLRAAGYTVEPVENKILAK